MPPMAKWYLLGRNEKDDENLSTFEKFFDIEKISEAVTIISMDEFLHTVAAKGMLKKPLPMMAVNLKVTLFSTENRCRIENHKSFEPNAM
jgi:hypothetical protein